VGEAARTAASELPGGRLTAFRGGVQPLRRSLRFATSELGYVLQVERHEGKVAGHDDTVVTELRATLVFRCEDGVWKIAHRHADDLAAGALGGRLSGGLGRAPGVRVLPHMSFSVRPDV
jgi:hypothetical protein